MRTRRSSDWSKLAVAVLGVLFLPIESIGQEIVGMNVTPHRLSAEMKWRRPPNPELSAKTELFLQNNTSDRLELSAETTRFDGQSPQELLDAGLWAWHDTPASWLAGGVTVPPDCLVAFTVNGKSSAWGVGTEHQLAVAGSPSLPFHLSPPQAWLSAVTFLAVDDEGRLSDAIRPNRIVVHVENAGEAVQLEELRVWLPAADLGSHHVFRLAHRLATLARFPQDGVIAANSKGGCSVDCEPLPLTYGVLELRVRDTGSSAPRSLWARLRIKPEAFDISGGWVASDVGGRNSLTIDEYRRTLKRMHINTGQIEEVGGFTDDAQVYAQLPLKRFNRLWPLERYDRDEMLPHVHAVEFLGEPQYGGGRPVPPQEVWEKLAPYEPSRLATSVTLSEEHSWRYYAGLSDYPHYDAYRVIAPAADAWRAYDRWGGERIGWGAPLETIGVMTRSLRELSRPRPIAYWSQGAHRGWGDRRNSRRGSPNPDELRSQAWHGLANRVTSLYWFNLSLESLVAFPDLIEPITRVNREIGMLQEIMLEGDAYEYRRLTRDGVPDWDLNSIASASTLLLVAHDLRYRIDPDRREFQFDARDAELSFQLPRWLAEDLHVFRVDAQGTSDVEHGVTDDAVALRDRIRVVGMYVATRDAALRQRLEAEATRLRELENETGFDPGASAEDLKQLASYLGD